MKSTFRPRLLNGQTGDPALLLNLRWQGRALLADPVFTVEAVPLDHRIVSMAYAVTERTHLNVRAEALAASGLRPGRWLNTLKDAVRAGAPADTPIEVVPGSRRPLAALREELL